MLDFNTENQHATHTHREGGCREGDTYILCVCILDELVKCVYVLRIFIYCNRSGTSNFDRKAILFIHCWRYHFIYRVSIVYFHHTKWRAALDLRFERFTYCHFDYVKPRTIMLLPHDGFMNISVSSSVNRHFSGNRQQQLCLLHLKWNKTVI